MIHYDIGSLAFSKAGHDKKNLFIIIKEDWEYVYLVDGKNRTLERPKKKNKKHIQVIHYIEETLQNKMNADIRISNEDIKRAIKCCKSKYEI